jgi:hypothetical protein
MGDMGIFAGIDSDTKFRMFVATFMGLVGVVVFFWEFKIPTEKHTIAGEPKDLKIRTFDYPARVMIFKLNDIVVALGAPTPLFEPPDISNNKIEVYGDMKRAEKLPDLIFWNSKGYLKSLASKIFFATRIKNLSTANEYEVPLLVPAVQVVLWILIIVIPFFLLPYSAIIRIREIIHIGPTWILIPVFGIIGLILAIILPNWIIERRKLTRSY